jgi:hypothetical protein
MVICKKPFVRCLGALTALLCQNEGHRIIGSFSERSKRTLCVDWDYLERLQGEEKLDNLNEDGRRNWSWLLYPVGGAGFRKILKAGGFDLFPLAHLSDIA